MRTITVILVSIFALTADLCHAQQKDNTDDSRNIPLFVQSLKKLHREPPSPPAKTREFVQMEWIEQKLDHFDETETRTWNMRYLVNDENFKEGGPMFIVLGGEWEISPGLIRGGHFYDMAEEHNAILYYTEHRYYGESRPTPDITVENLEYLHVKQALADVAHFVKHIRESNSTLANAKVIMAGGSYSATMVVWFKRLYPELMDGGWASSAPILAKVDFKEYKEVAGRSYLELGSKKCYDRIQNGIAEMESMFANKRGAEVKAMMKLCNTFDENNDLDLWGLFTTIGNIFSGIAQAQNEGDIPNVCEFLMSFEDDVSAIASLLLAFSEGNCNEITYKAALDYFMNSTYENEVLRQWYYQTCNEYGWYHSSNSAEQPFGTKSPITLSTTLCYDIFGKKYTNENIHLNVEKTNDFFGGMTPEVEHIYMTHGALDPWHPMGHGEKEGATIIPRVAHCKDFLSISEEDSAEMRASKEKLSKHVREWLA